PALLRHQRPRGDPHGEPECVRGGAPTPLRAARAGPRDGAARRSPGRALGPPRVFPRGPAGILPRPLPRAPAEAALDSAARAAPGRDRGSARGGAPRALPRGAEARRGTGPSSLRGGEKILSRGERLPDDWAMHGTTGYEFANVAGGVFVDGSSEQAMT